MFAAIRNNETNKIKEIPVPTNRRKSLLAPNNFNHLRRVPLSEMSNMGFCNGPLFVNPSLSLARYPFAGLVLLYGVGAQAAT